jgi:hypothetical protein
VATGWQGSNCLVAFLVATIIQGMLVLNYESSYTPEPYQGTLLSWAVMAFAVSFNIFLS